MNTTSSMMSSAPIGNGNFCITWVFFRGIFRQSVRYFRRAVLAPKTLLGSNMCLLIIPSCMFPLDQHSVGRGENTRRLMFLWEIYSAMSLRVLNSEISLNSNGFPVSGWSFPLSIFISFSLSWSRKYLWRSSFSFRFLSISGIGDAMSKRWPTPCCSTRSLSSVVKAPGTTASTANEHLAMFCSSWWNLLSLVFFWFTSSVAAHFCGQLKIWSSYLSVHFTETTFSHRLSPETSQDSGAQNLITYLNYLYNMG